MTYMPLVYDHLSHRTLLDAQIALAQYLKKNFSVIHYISATNFFQDVRGFQREGFGMQVLYTALSDLTDFGIMKVEQKQRNIIYKAQKENITVEETTDMKPLWDIYISTFDRKSIEPPYSKDFFLALPQLGENIRIYTAKKDDQLLGFAAILLQGKGAYYYVSGNTPKGLSLGASPLLMFTIWRNLRAKAICILIGAPLTYLALPTSNYPLGARPYLISPCITNQSGLECLGPGNNTFSD